VPCELKSSLQSTRSGGRNRIAGTLTIALLLLAACSGGGGSPGVRSIQPPTAGIKAPTKIGVGEGQLNLVAWQGYTDSTWVDPFVKQTGCKLNTRFANSPDEMVSLMADGGGGQWDMVSASGDIGLRLIYDGAVRPMNAGLIPDYASFQPELKSPPFNTVNGTHYGLSVQWGPNLLIFNAQAFAAAPTSWDVLYKPAYSGKIAVPNSPMQIADAALLLMKKQPSLKIADPFELTQPQFDAAMALLKSQQPLVKYWKFASEEISFFQNDQVVVGAAWPYQSVNLTAANVPIKETIPSEGATAWADTWMMATRATHPNCAYLWTRYISTPKIQAMQAISYGEIPVNSKACAEMEIIQAHSCAQYHADASASYLSSIRFWKTPMTTCDDGSQKCVPYAKWQAAWTTVAG
jgi:putative spermidine/putrescine transport system substrate-binding protein